jgi:hypothetical protein
VAVGGYGAVEVAVVEAVDRGAAGVVVAGSVTTAGVDVSDPVEIVGEAVELVGTVLVAPTGVGVPFVVDTSVGAVEVPVVEDAMPMIGTSAGDVDVPESW